MSMTHPATWRYTHVNLGIREVYLEIPNLGAVYTKQIWLHIIKNTTLEGSPEGGKLIPFLGDYKFVPGKRGLYKVLERDKKGMPIFNDNCGMTARHNKN